MKKIKLLGILPIVLLLFMCTGCKQDDMEDIDIIVTNYANEYIVSELYGKHANISSIYPDGINVNDYKITNKQKKDFSTKELFIYNGLVKSERSLAVNLLDLNSNLKIEGVLLTMLDARTNLGIQVIDEVKKYFQDKVYQTIIPRNIRLSEAPSHGEPIIIYDAKSRGAEVYLDLAKEVVTNG